MADSRHVSGDGCLLRAWSAHEPDVRSFLRRRAPDSTTADDLLQDVFVKAVRQEQRFCAVQNPRAWLFEVARNVLADHLRSSRPAEVLTDEMAGALADAPEPEAPVHALTGCLERVLSELEPDDAQVLRACDLEGLTQREFAARSGLTLSAAKSRLLRARRRLRKSMTVACQVRFDDQGAVEGHVPRPAGASNTSPG